MQPHLFDFLVVLAMPHFHRVWIKFMHRTQRETIPMNVYTNLLL